MNAELVRLVADYVQAREARDKLDQDIRYLESAIRDRVAPGQKADLGDGHGVKVVPSVRKFDPELAEQILTTDQLTMICVPTISRTKAERLLVPALYDQCKRPVGQPSVRLL